MSKTEKKQYSGWWVILICGGGIFIAWAANGIMPKQKAAAYNAPIVTTLTPAVAAASQAAPSGVSAFCKAYPEAVRDSTAGSFAHIPAKLIKLSSTCSRVDSRLQVKVDPKVGNVVHATVLAGRIARATKGQGNVIVAVWYTAGTSPKGEQLYREHSTAKYYRDFDNVKDLTVSR